jgi:hypothetical protein
MTGNTALRRIRLGALAQAGASTAGVGKAELDVSEIKAYAMREPVSRRSYTVLEVQTKGGLTGYGECGAAAPEALALAKQAAVGQAATSYEVIGNWRRTRECRHGGNGAARYRWQVRESAGLSGARRTHAEQSARSRPLMARPTRSYWPP